MNYDEIQHSLWPSYVSAVENILQDPEAPQWLDSPLDSVWGGRTEEQLWARCGEKRADDTTWLLKAKNKVQRLSGGSLLLFWILHITAALSFPLMAHNSRHKGNSGPEVNAVVIS